MKLVTESRTSLLGRVSRYLTEKGITSYLVGGTVRDILLGRATGDIDIAISADAPQTAAHLAEFIHGKYVLLDEVNKIGRVVVTETAGSLSKQLYFDLATLRGTVTEDLAKRDFTINAIAVDLNRFYLMSESPATLKEEIKSLLIDPFGGFGDLSNNVIKAVSREAFMDDPVRLLRAVRLAADLNFTIHLETETAIREDALLINKIAGERIREELLRTLHGEERSPYLAYMDRLGLLSALIPELNAAKVTSQPKEHYWNVFEHSLNTVTAAEFLLREGRWSYIDCDILSAVPWSDELAAHFEKAVGAGSTHGSLLKLAALLHDIAKPQTKILTEEGRTRFFGHDREGAETTVNIMERLRFSSREIKLVEIMVQNHLRPGQLGQPDEFPTRKAIYRYFRDTGDAGIDILFLSLADHLAARGPSLDLREWRRHTRIVDYVLRSLTEEKIAAPPKIINGNDIINTFNLKPGPEVGVLLEAVREAQAAGELSTREEALALINSKLREKQDR